MPWLKNDCRELQFYKQPMGQFLKFIKISTHGFCSSGFALVRF